MTETTAAEVLMRACASAAIELRKKGVQPLETLGIVGRILDQNAELAEMKWGSSLYQTAVDFIKKSCGLEISYEDWKREQARDTSK
jgi:hypothetical protein